MLRHPGASGLYLKRVTRKPGGGRRRTHLSVGPSSSPQNQSTGPAPSVRVHLTGVAPLLPRLLVQPQEVLVARRAAHPRLSEPHQAREEEVALAGLGRALEGHVDAAAPAPHAHAAGRKHLGLLPVEAADVHGDGRALRLPLHRPDAAPGH